MEWRCGCRWWWMRNAHRNCSGPRCVRVRSQVFPIHQGPRRRLERVSHQCVGKEEKEKPADWGLAALPPATPWILQQGHRAALPPLLAATVGAGEGRFILQSLPGKSPHGLLPQQASRLAQASSFTPPLPSQMGPIGYPPPPATCQLTTTENSLRGAPSLKKNSLQFSFPSKDT